MSNSATFKTTGLIPRTGVWCAMLLGVGLLTAPLASAQTLKFLFNFEDTGTTTADTQSGVVLNMVNSSGTATDYHGATGTGVGGAGKALNFTSNPDAATAGTKASAVNNATLGLGVVSSWTVTEWVNPSAINANLARLFIAGANGTTDFGQANSFGYKVKSTSGSTAVLQVNINTTEATAVEPTISLPLGSWTFIAYTFDGTTLSMYVGTATTAAQLAASSSSYAGQSINFGTSGSLFLGSRSDQTRSLKGYIDDTRFYTGAGDAAFVESVRQAGLPVVATNTWDNGAGTRNWNTTDANWNGGGKWINANVALFGATGVGTVSVTEAISAYNVTVTNAGYTIAAGGGTLEISGVISNSADVRLSALVSAGGLTKVGSGILTVATNMTYPGSTIVNGGTLTLDASAGGLYWGSASGNVQINSGGILSFSGGISYQSQAFKNLGPSAGTIVINGGTLQHTGISNAKSSADVGSGHLFDIGVLGATLDSATAGQEFSLGYRYDYSLGVLTSAGGTLTLTGVGNGDLNYSLPGTGGLVKQGTGTWKLSNTNSYSGPTIIENGTLQLTNAASGGQGVGSITNTPIITISNGATFNVSAVPFAVVSNQTLMVNGVVTGAVTVAAGGALEGGGTLVNVVTNYGVITGGATNSGGTLTVSNLVMQEKSVYIWNYNDTTQDLINVAGILTLPTTATVTVSRASGTTRELPNPVVLFTFGSALPPTSLTGWEVIGARSDTRAVVQGSQVKLVSTSGLILEIY